MGQKSSFINNQVIVYQKEIILLKLYASKENPEKYLKKLPVVLKGGINSNAKVEEYFSNLDIDRE